jgi:hypothetical protein
MPDFQMPLPSLQKRFLVASLRTGANPPPCADQGHRTMALPSLLDLRIREKSVMMPARSPRPRPRPRLPLEEVTHSREANAPGITRTAQQWRH